MNGEYVLRHVGGVSVYEHRWVWEQANGAIPEGFHVHHGNGDRRDNRLENLELLSVEDHGREHGREGGAAAALHAASLPDVPYVCVECGATFTAKQPALTCSVACQLRRSKRNRPREERLAASRASYQKHIEKRRAEAREYQRARRAAQRSAEWRP